jgi:hypothetical protein
MKRIFMFVDREMRQDIKSRGSSKIMAEYNQNNKREVTNLAGATNAAKPPHLIDHRQLVNSKQLNVCGI